MQKHLGFPPHFPRSFCLYRLLGRMRLAVPQGHRHLVIKLFDEVPRRL